MCEWSMPDKVIQGIDYYIDEQSGLMVFTDHFHLSRGFCCGNKCKHCPYHPKHVKGNTLIDEKHKLKT